MESPSGTVTYLVETTFDPGWPGQFPTDWGCAEDPNDPDQDPGCFLEWNSCLVVGWIGQECGLRDAIEAANEETAASVTIIVPAGNYRLYLGQLFIGRPMTIRGSRRGSDGHRRAARLARDECLDP